MVSPMTTIVSDRRPAGPADLSPDIVLTDGEARLIADTPAIGRRGDRGLDAVPGRVFETLAWGRRHVVMGATRSTGYGNQNLSAFGPIQHPTRQMFWVRGAPATPSTTPPATGSATTPAGCSAMNVDIVSGIGWGTKVDPDNPAYRFVNVHRGCQQPGCVRLQRTDHTMRAVSLHVPVSEPDQVAENTRSRWPGWTPLSGPACPSAEEQRAARGDRPERTLRDKEVKVYGGLRTPLTELVGIEHPVVQTGMGWVARQPAWWRPPPTPAVWASSRRRR